MIKKHLKVLIITSVIVLLPILAGVILWDQLPSEMPTHWNASGEVDGWSSKPMAVFGMPLFLLAVQWLAVFATLADPKKKNHSKKILHLVFWLVPILSLVVNVATYAVALGKDVPIDVIIPIFIGMLFVIIGNYLPKCKQNYTIGIKIPWTLNSEDNWNRTHRLAGWLWVVCGVVIIVSGFFRAFLISVPAVLIMVLVPLVYSYLLHRKSAPENKEETNNE